MTSADPSHADRGHSFFSPSGAHQWLACPGGWQAHLLVEQAPSPYAEEGTRAHELAEWLLRNDRNVVIDAPEDMLDAAMEYVNFATAGADGADTVLIEHRVDFSHLTPIPGQGGTLDHAALIPYGPAILTDFKYGAGVKVYAERNPQLMIYALAILNEYDAFYDFPHFHLRIAQPRLDHFDSWTVGRDELIEFGEYVRERAALVLQPDAPRVPGEKQCRWCRVAATCPARLAQLQETAVAVFEDDAEPVALAPPEDLPVERLVHVMRNRATVEQWFGQIEAHLTRKALAGEPVPGMKMVEGRTHRRWADEKTLPISWFKPKAMTPTEVEAWLREDGTHTKAEAQEIVAEHTVKPPGRPTLVFEHDKRPALEAGSVFAIENEGQDDES